MNLETEFRIRQQLSRLAQSLYGCSYGVGTEHCITLFEPQPGVSDWVKLKYPPAQMSHDEALLLCQYSAEYWLAWVPDYGEVLLAIDEFISS